MMNNSLIFLIISGTNGVVQTRYKPGTNNPIFITFYYSVWTR
jgi:hypothetical protein